MSSPLVAELAGRAARDALAGGEGEVVAVFRRSFYVRAGGRYACIGDPSLGRGPLNVLVRGFEEPVLQRKIAVNLENAQLWEPAPFRGGARPHLDALRKALDGHVPEEGLGCTILGIHNALTVHAQPALEALDRWFAGHALANEAAQLIGLGPGLTPSGDDFLGGVMLALHHAHRQTQARGLWRWLEPRLSRTSAISGAHLAAAAAGEGHEALHAALRHLFQSAPGWPAALERLDAIGHCSGWDALAGAFAVARNCG